MSAIEIPILYLNSDENIWNALLVFLFITKVGSNFSID